MPTGGTVRGYRPGRFSPRKKRQVCSNVERLANLAELRDRAQAGLPLFEAGAGGAKGRSIEAKSAKRR